MWTGLNLAAVVAVVYSYSRHADRLGLKIEDSVATPRSCGFQACGCGVLMLSILFSGVAAFNPFLLILSLPLMPIGLGIGLFLGEPDHRSTGRAEDDTYPDSAA